MSFFFENWSFFFSTVFFCTIVSWEINRLIDRSMMRVITFHESFVDENWRIKKSIKIPLSDIHLGRNRARGYGVKG